MTQLTWRIFATTCLLVGSCAHETRVKIYVSQPEKGGLERAQEREILPYGTTEGFFCVSPGDLEIMLLEAQERKGDQ